MLFLFLLGLPALALIFLVYAFSFGARIEPTKEAKSLGLSATLISFVFVLLNFFLPGFGIPSWLLIVYSLILLGLLIFFARKFHFKKLKGIQRLSLVFVGICLLLVAVISIFLTATNGGA
ncbi:hypothetical protein [Lactococcus termiticola]|uniref:Uncharacterized protein n=1 Tax=Lactococcus termiticola TaxID=2169526 RepID=A0A2R5HK55_9LACT|nr:hypothetical protein [Lactococcus termiticola]GBG97128.1 hypothetical protein NtB2_01265 [Lactococcus termiticola]